MQFHEVLPAFIRNTTATIFVMKLSERLDEHPLIIMIGMGNCVVSPILMHLVMIKCSSVVFEPYTHDHRQVKANIQRLL